MEEIKNEWKKTDRIWKCRENINGGKIDWKKENGKNNKKHRKMKVKENK